MKRFLALVGVVAIASLAVAQVFYSENVTAGASGAAVPTLSNWASARRVRVTMLTADAGLYVRFFRDLLKRNWNSADILAQSHLPLCPSNAVCTA